MQVLCSTLWIQYSKKSEYKHKVINKQMLLFVNQGGPQHEPTDIMYKEVTTDWEPACFTCCSLLMPTYKLTYYFELAKILHHPRLLDLSRFALDSIEIAVYLNHKANQTGHLI